MIKLGLCLGFRVSDSIRAMFRVRVRVWFGVNVRDLKPQPTEFR